jgi:hypothetical protein
MTENKKTENRVGGRSFDVFWDNIAEYSYTGL